MSGSFLVFVYSCLWLMPLMDAFSSDIKSSSLEGIWQAKSVVRNGKNLPAKDIAWMQFRFQGENLYVKGNFVGDKEVQCTYQLNEEVSPKQLDFKPNNESKTVFAIFCREGSTLTVCIRPSSSLKSRPETFESGTGTDTLLVVFEQKKSE